MTRVKIYESNDSELVDAHEGRVKPMKKVTHVGVIASQMCTSDRKTEEITDSVACEYCRAITGKAHREMQWLEQKVCSTLGKRIK